MSRDRGAEEEALAQGLDPTIQPTMNILRDMFADYEKGD